MHRSRKSSGDSPHRAERWNQLPADGWLAVDTETTGRGDDAEIVELAVVDTGGKIVFESLIRPSVAVSPGAERLHGLTGDRLAGAPRLGDVYRDLRGHLAHRVLVAYSAGFDRRVLRTSCLQAGLAVIPATWLCALDLYESLRRFRPPLHVACEIEGVEPPGTRHRAAADALALQRLVVKLREVAGDRTVL